MPFDLPLLATYDQPDLGVDPRLVRRRQLMAMLNNIPDNINGTDFRWDFGTTLEDDREYEDGWCGSVGCAVGVMYLLQPLQKRVDWDWSDSEREMAELLGLTIAQASSVFFGIGRYGGGYEKVTPQMVAAELSKFGDEIFEFEAEEEEDEDEDEDEDPEQYENDLDPDSL